MQEEMENSSYSSSDSNSSVEAKMESGSNSPMFSDDLLDLDTPISCFSPPIDHISALPDSILQHILSSFLPLKDAIKTSVLSKRWRYAWTEIPILNFCQFSRTRSDTDIPQFVSFIDKTLTLRLHTATKVEKLHISFTYYMDFRCLADNWIRLAAECNVKELCLHFNTAFAIDNYQFPQSIYSNSSLRSLNTTRIDFKAKPDESISWTSLKVLSIGDTTLNSDTIAKILLGSPKLECLKLIRCCWGEDKVIIKSKHLKQVVVEELKGDRDGSVMEIWGSAIRSLSLTGYMHQRRFKLMNMSSLEEANLDFSCSVWDERSYFYVLLQILEELRHVQKLTIGTWLLQVLSLFSEERLPSSLSECKHLILYVDNKKWKEIVMLLKSSPGLEKLNINIMPPDEHTRYYGLNTDLLEPSLTEVEKYWNSMKGYLKHLKSVVVSGFRENSCVELNIFCSMVEFLLKNAIVLEKMVIYAESYSSHGFKKPVKAQKKLLYLFKVSQLFLSCPRASPNAVVLFKPSPGI